MARGDYCRTDQQTSSLPRTRYFPALVVHNPRARTIQKIQMYDWLVETLASQRQFNVTLHRPDGQGQMQWPLIQRVAIRNGGVLFDRAYAKYIEKI
ncbi:hypothetical protein WJ970_05075 [Achromobacter xylosoxidans]